ncbi:efflux transporter outer membrane subunit [Bryobacter aggregatus]|uniref:efflux transporter outer membrane subunit n=1 Tax=Bryobacter aggregatus TaxID=360054 RepID=UPI0004E25C61|nr:efflux transporter outer membrane subunit [Bryobacter aggregatus]
MRHKALSLALLGFELSCTMGPKYQRPSVPAPPAFRDTAVATPSPESLGDAKWWTVFEDEELQKLIRTALAQNYDVRIAASRIVQAQAQLGITRADQFPSISGTGGANRQRNPSNPVFPAFEANMSQLGLSSVWQLDFWGRYRRATEASRATLAASEWGRKAVLGTLVSNVATAYFQLRELDLELEISRRTLAARNESLTLTRTMESGGAISLLDVAQAEKLVELAARKVPDLERRITQQENLIQILLGENPGPVARGKALAAQVIPPAIPEGLPSQLLERRPDIRQAELQLVAANANVGVAKAMYFPQLSLTGTAGFQAYSLTGLFDSKVYNIGAAMTQPIFDFGRIRNNVRLTEAQKEEILLTYLQNVQQAFREVSDALIAIRKNREYRERQQALTLAAQSAAKLSELRYRGGASSYLEVLTSETDLLDAEIDLAQAQLNERLAIVQIYNALGGGWQQ